MDLKTEEVMDLKTNDITKSLDEVSESLEHINESLDDIKESVNVCCEYYRKQQTLAEEGYGSDSDLY